MKQPPGALEAARKREQAKRAAQTPSANGKHARLILQRLDALKPQPVRYLVPGFIPLAKLCMLAGDGDGGKSSITNSIAADHSRARPALGQHYTAAEHETLFFSCEDDPEDTMVPRLLALGADLAKIHRLKTAVNSDGKPMPFSLSDVDLVDASLEAHPKIRMVVIDPVGAYMGRTGRDDYKDSELRTVLDPLAELAGRRNVAIILIKHLNKASSASARHRISGSTGYVNACRQVFLVALAPEDSEEDRRVMLPIKSNLMKERRGLAFRLSALPDGDAQRVIEQHAQHLSPADRQRLRDQLFGVKWLGTTDDNADAVLNDNRQKSRPKIKQCADWLRAFLADHAYPSKEIEEAAAKEGFSRDDVFRAKAALKTAGLRNRKRGMGEWWSGFGDPDNWQYRAEIPE